jgi:hypothetical protein
MYSHHRRCRHPSWWRVNNGEMKNLHDFVRGKIFVLEPPPRLYFQPSSRTLNASRKLIFCFFIYAKKKREKLGENVCLQVINFLQQRKKKVPITTVARAER